MVPSEALSLVALTADDVAGGLALSAAAGWNQVAEDWALFIDQGHALGFRTASGVLVATAAAIVYSGGLGWISLVLVDPAWRHRGLASLLLDGCIKRLQSLHVEPVLDATPAGEPVYRHLGFRSGFEFERWQGVARLAPHASQGIRATTAADLEAIVLLDQAASGLGRRTLLTHLLRRGDTRGWMARDGSGFLLARTGSRAIQIGPVVAADEGAAAGLLATALDALAGPVFLDVPKRWAALAAWLEQGAFSRQRPYLRMSQGSAKPLACGEQSFVLAGPEFG